MEKSAAATVGGLGEESTFASYHPLVTFFYFTGVIILSMFSMNPVFLLLTLASSFVYSVLLGGGRAVRFNLLFLIPILFFTAVLNPLSNHRGVTVLFYLSGNPMTLEAFLYGLASAAMLISVVMWFSCFHKIITSDKIIYLFGRVIPVIALLLSMCFRFIPLLKNRFREIHEGQQCMGRRYPQKALIKRGRQLAKELSILIAWSLEAAIETSDSMEARGYGLPGRTSFHIFKFTRRDAKALALILALLTALAAACLLGVNEIYYYPSITLCAPWALTAGAGCIYALLLVLPIIIDVRGEREWKKWRFTMSDSPIQAANERPWRISI